MFIYKYNQYTKKYYQYDTDFHDILGPDFDETLHSNDIVPPYSSDCDKTRCGYCNTVFPSRNKLFYHLGFMNIDISNHNDTMCVDGYNSDMGDYGFSMRHSKKKKRKRNRYKAKQYFKKKYQQRNKGTNIKDINLIMESLNICG